MKGLLFCVSLLVTFSILSPYAFAASPTYLSVVQADSTQILFKVKQLGSQSQMLCSIESFNCNPTGADFVLPVASSSESQNTTTAVLDAVQTEGALPPDALWKTVSPNGRYVAYYIPATEKKPNRTFGIYDVRTGKIYSKIEKNILYWDLLSDGLQIFSFSPDSTKLLYSSDKDGYQTVYVVPLKSLSRSTFTESRITSKKYSMIDFGWIDAKNIYFTANREQPLQWNLYTYQLSSATLKLAAQNVSYNDTIKQIQNKLLFTALEGNTALPKLFDSTTNTISSFAIPEVTPSPLPKTQIVTEKGVTGVFWQAAPTTTLVVWLHGGPYRQTSAGYHSYFSYAGYDWVLQELVDSGVPVLKLDYPGSFGYGRTFAESIRLKVGVKDVAMTDAAITQFARKHGYTNIILMGNSYGGYLAPKLLVEKPDTYTGAIAINGVWDWSTLTDELQTSIFNVQFQGTQNSKNTKLYDAASILDRLGNLTTQKILIIHGDSDTTIPYEQSQLAYDILKQMGKAAELVPFSGEDHVYSSKNSFVTLCQKTLTFVGVSDADRCIL